MVITANAAPRLCAATPRPQPAPPTPPSDHVQLGRVASGIAGGALGGVGLGLLGAQGGARMGLLIGMETTPKAAGLAELLSRSMQGAAWGYLGGAAVLGAAGVTLGVAGACYLYDRQHQS